VPVIRITDVTWERLKRWAIPLEDSPEDALQKVLHAAEEHLKCPQSAHSVSGHPAAENARRKQHGKLPRGLKTPQAAYRRPILEAVDDLGGSARVSQVLELVEGKMRSSLNEYDHQKLASGTIRWCKTAQWARLDLVRDGFLKSDSPSGLWEISHKGIQEIQRLGISGRGH